MKLFNPVFVSLFSFFIFVSNLEAQGNIEGGLYTEYSQFGYYGQFAAGGVLYIPWKDRFTLNYEACIGRQNNRGFYAHAPAGALSGAYLIGQASGVTFLNYLGVLLFLVPEGVGMYVTEGKISTHISVNPLGFDYWYKRDPYDETGCLSGSIVFRLKMPLQGYSWPLFVAPQVAVTWLYGNSDPVGNPGLRAGVCIGFDAKNNPFRDDPFLDDPVLRH
ncbi:MAG TPA: hypothetical protein VFU15_13530 [Bacteroidia bacterium]|nr:hypothetical protein [Bacteroidia bacterium]